MHFYPTERQCQACGDTGVHPTGTAGPQSGASCCCSTGGSREPSRPGDAPVESYLRVPSSFPKLTCWLCPASHRAWLHRGLHPQAPAGLQGERANARLRKKLQTRPAPWRLNPPGSHRRWTEMNRQSHRNNHALGMAAAPRGFQGVPRNLRAQQGPARGGQSTPCILFGWL